MTISSSDKRAFYRDLRLAFERHPKFAGRIALAEIPAAIEAEEKVSEVLGVRLSRSRARVCVKWGVDPTTGQRVCIQWADAGG